MALRPSNAGPNSIAGSVQEPKSRAADKSKSAVVPVAEAVVVAVVAVVAVVVAVVVASALDALSVVAAVLVVTVAELAPEEPSTEAKSVYSSLSTESILNRTT